MATILGTWELGFGYGHIAHLAPVAHALQATGHRMVLAARTPATAQAAPGQPFAAVLQAPLHRVPPGPKRPTLTYAQVIGDGGMNDAAAAILLVRQWLALFEQVGAEAIVAEHAPVSLLAAHVAGLPAAMLGSSFAVPPATRPLPALMPWLSTSEDERQAADAEADAVVRAVCAAFDAPMLDGVAELLARARPYLTTWPEFDIHGPRKGVTYYGPMAGYAGTSRPGWPKGDGTRCFVYLPFDSSRAADVVAALADLGWPVIWHSARPPEAPLPPTIRYVPQPADIPHVLGEAGLFVGRGSHGSGCMAMAAGCPQVVLPDTLDSVLTARQIVRYDLGVATTRAGPEGVRQALGLAVERPGIAAALAATKARYARYRPEVAARQLVAALIEDLQF